MNCPICRKPVAHPPKTPELAKVLPFCSERCQLIDLGRWLDGRYQIPADRDDGDPRADAGSLDPEDPAGQ